MENDYPRKKQCGFILSVALAVYNAICFLTDDFLELCNVSPVFYLFFCVILILTIRSSLSDKSTSHKMSVGLLIFIGISFFLDVFLLFGFAASLNSEGLDPTLFIALENILIAVCNIVILVETGFEHKEIRIPFDKIFRKREDSSDDRSSGDLNILEIILIILVTIFLFVYTLQ